MQNISRYIAYGIHHIRNRIANTDNPIIKGFNLFNLLILPHFELVKSSVIVIKRRVYRFELGPEGATHVSLNEVSLFRSQQVRTTAEAEPITGPPLPMPTPPTIPF